MSLRDASMMTQLITVLAAFVVGYSIPFILIQIIFYQQIDPAQLYLLLFTKGSTAAIVNLASLAIGILSAFLVFLWLKPHEIKPIVVRKPKVAKKKAKKKSRRK